jgi:hypothetical protein
MKRIKQDKEENNRKCLAANTEKGIFEETKWSRLRVGTVVKILKD